ncbi:arsenate reductase ArsC [Kordiimonas sp. SCSIO 12603]|uniref:arsenate reductase ArsC n=1 Tax=Kordiimonas sp. SCSIO 12603 TaxID=2829596 RepID=UPI0021037CB0|nr:arsenate reductase ArsC [Kordiimonas sp. SCSIO 12603]UTW59411.1 arsenate reductase ArsC [Kordiimonas sp. SCSIO 12603]
MKILYICTHNRCRSVLSEALTNHMGGGKIEARSAGSQPVGEVHPLTKHYLAEHGVPTHGLLSKSWDDMEDFTPDVVVTVCDSAAGESCPVWMGKTLKLHWGLEDPSKIEGTDAEKAEAFRATIREIERRVERMLAFDFSSMDQAALKAAMAEMGAH